MTVVLNEPAINRLFLSFPFIRDSVDKQAEASKRALDSRIAVIISEPANRPRTEIHFTSEGAEVGIVNEAGMRPDRESISEYLDFKLGVQEPWWQDVGEEAARGA